jgi:CubicO group peptidase (beta-lactamase class C family)
MVVVDIPSAGEAWPPLEPGVDRLVGDLIAQAALPGLTLAVTRHGRLVALKGYGYARLESKTDRKVRMTPDARIRGGSITKPLVTGAATMQLLRSKGIEASKVRLYGPTGLFKGRFDADIDIGINAHSAGAADRKQWYRAITIQHLLDHAAGFARSGDTDGAAKLFGIPEEQLTYDHVHRHFLRVNALRYEPGSPPSEIDPYSNHGFGLLTLVIEQIAGLPYHRYVQEQYLRPLGLHHQVRPEWAHEDSCDAFKHNRAGEDGVTTIPFEQWGLGLAAGGFRYTAESLVRLMGHLAQTHTVEELDDAGWGANAKGRLAHSGSTGGGTAYVTMFPRGYRSDGRDLSRVHIGILTPVKMADSGLLRSLASAIALEVADSRPDDDFDLFAGRSSHDRCEWVRLAVPAADYQGVFDEAVRGGYRLEWIDGYSDGGKLHFNAIFRTRHGGGDWVSHHNLTADEYQKRFNTLVDAGYSLTHVDAYPVGKGVRYAAIWVKGAGPMTAYHGRTLAQHQASFDELTDKGWKPKVLSFASGRYAALYDRADVGAIEARSRLTPDEYQARSEANFAQGRQLRYLNAYADGGKPFFTAIWAAKPALSRYEARHELTRARCEELRRDANATGSRTSLVIAHPHDGGVRFAGCWGKS